jgi:hypothetical protein
MASRNELAALHVRAEQLKTSLGSRRRNFIADPSAWTEHQVPFYESKFRKYADFKLQINIVE